MRTIGFVLMSCVLASAQPGPTPMPQGPLHTQGNMLLDSAGHVIVLKGTEMPGLNVAHPDPSGVETQTAAALTATTFSTIRLRWNMNALRLPVSSWIDGADPAYLPRVSDIVRKANAAGLVVILAEYDDLRAGAPSTAGLPAREVATFWKTWAAAFKDNPMVIFDVYNQPQPTYIPGHQDGTHSAGDWQFWLRGGRDTNGRQTVGMQGLVDAIRSTGATQVIAVMGLSGAPEMQGLDTRAYIRDANILYETHPRYDNDFTIADRDAHFGFLSSRFPVLAASWGLTLDEDSAECRAIPQEPDQAEALVNDTLAYFESHNISWIASAFAPGKLILDFDSYYHTELSQGWTCGQPAWPPPGIGEVVRYYLWGVDDTNIVPVNGGSGSLVIAPDSLVVAYGIDLARTTASVSSQPLPTALGGVGIRIVDSAGAVLLAPLLYVSPDLIHFLVPPETAPGFATVSVLNDDGTGPQGKMLIERVAPGLFTAEGSGRGAALAFEVRQTPDGTEENVPLYQCAGGRCTTVPVRIPPAGSAHVILLCTGIRSVSSPQSLLVTIGGIPVPIVSVGPAAELPWDDQLTVTLGPELRGLGETDVIFTADGRTANAVRLNVR